MKLEFFIHKQHNKHVFRYWFPHWLNCITWEKGIPKIYKWLWFGIAITKKKQ